VTADPGVGSAAAVDVAVELTGVVKVFAAAAAVRVLDGVDLSVEPGEVVAVAGRSGSGKTTLLTIVAGWDAPDAGSVVVVGAQRAPHGPAWSEVAVVPQSLGLLEELTVAENITLPGRLGKDGTAGSGTAGSDAATLMRQLAIDHLADRYPSEVSLGEQQRAAVARAAVVQPRLLLADEPIAHQDAGRAEAIMFVLRRLADTGTACLVATHNELAFEAADRCWSCTAAGSARAPDR
jgi:putative ABC transport system ATP-binding protein